MPRFHISNIYLPGKMPEVCRFSLFISSCTLNLENIGMPLSWPWSFASGWINFWGQPTKCIGLRKWLALMTGPQILSLLNWFLTLCFHKNQCVPCFFVFTQGNITDIIIVSVRTLIMSEIRMCLIVNGILQFLQLCSFLVWRRKLQRQNLQSSVHGLEENPRDNSGTLL